VSLSRKGVTLCLLGGAIVHCKMDNFEMISCATIANSLVVLNFNFNFSPYQLSDQPSLEEAIRIASRIQQGETPGMDD